MVCAAIDGCTIMEGIMHETFDRKDSPYESHVAISSGIHLHSFEQGSEITLYTAGQLKQDLRTSVDHDACRAVILDLDGVHFMDSTAYGVIIGIQKHLSEINSARTPFIDFVVDARQADSSIPKIFETTGISQAIHVVMPE